MKYLITYLNLETMRREYYMNKTEFTKEEALLEIKLLKEQQEQYDLSGYGRTRAKFQMKKIKR